MEVESTDRATTKMFLTFEKTTNMKTDGSDLMEVRIDCSETAEGEGWREILSWKCIDDVQWKWFKDEATRVSNFEAEQLGVE